MADVIDTGRVFEIYSVGDGEFMRRVIDSVAAMSNSGLLLQLVGFGLMLGLLIMGFRNVMHGGNKLELGTTLVGIILGGIMFGLKADVIIHDMNFAPGEIDQPSYRVDNVPFGIAAAGYLISGTGYALTEKMETGYGLYNGGTSSLIEGGFGNTLEWINSIRMWEVPTLNDSGKTVARFRENLGTYVNECTLPAIEMKHLRYDAILTSTNLYSIGDASGAGGFGYSSQYLMFEYTNPDGSSSALTCGTGFNNIVGDSSSVVPAFAEAIGRSELDKSTGGSSSYEAMEDAFQVIGQNTTQMQNLVLAEAVGMSLENAVSGKTTAVALSTQTKMMIEQASMQRAVQWASEETLFRRVMRPMMAFFESLIYALAPFMAIMIGLGSFGIQTVMKYFMLSIWVILWMPMLSIIQLYQITMMQHASTALSVGADGLSTGVGSSIAGADHLRQMAIDWLGTGAMLASATPALTMALVWGGAVTASALAGKMQGGDHVNEKSTAPDAVSTASAMDAGSGIKHSKATGSSSQDSLASMPQMSTSSVTGYGASSKIGNMQSSTTQWADSVQRAMESTYGNNVSFSATSGNTHAGGRNSSGNSSWQAGNDADASNKVDATRAAQATNSAVKRDDSAVKASGGLEAFGIGATATKTGTDSQAQDVADLIRAARSGGGSSGSNAGNKTGESFASVQRAEEAVAALAKKDANFAQALKNSNSYGKSQTALDQAQKSYEQTGSFEQRYGSQQSVPVAQAAQDYLGSGGSSSNAVQAAQAAGVGGQANTAANTLFGGLLGSENKQTAGAMYALYQAAQQPGAYGLSQEQGKAAGEALNTLLTGGPMDMAGFMSGAVKPNTNAGMQTDTPNRDELIGSVEGNTPGSGVDANGLQGEVQSALTGGSGTQQNYANDVQGIVAANPGGYGPPLLNEQDAAAHVAAQGGAAIQSVEGQAATNAADGAVGLTQNSRSDSSDNTTVDAAGTITMYGGSRGSMPTMMQDGGDAIKDRMEAIGQVNPGMSEGARNFIAVAQELRENGSNRVPQESYDAALTWASENPGGAKHVGETFGSEHSGNAAMFEAGLQYDAQQKNK